MFPYYFVIVLFYSISILLYFLIRISLFEIYCTVVENLLEMPFVTVIVVAVIASQVQVQHVRVILLCCAARTAAFLALLSIISGIFDIARIFLLAIGVFGCIRSIFGKIVFFIILIHPITNDNLPLNLLSHFINRRYQLNANQQFASI